MSKEGFMDESEKDRFISEITLLKNIDHPCILKLHEVFQDDAKFYVVTELCEGGELFDQIIKRSKFTEHDCANVVKEILRAITYCHGENICHRDLKPENVLIDSHDNIKVIDFGTA
jgi:calcium-dependent protein kinase